MSGFPSTPKGEVYPSPLVPGSGSLEARRNGWPGSLDGRWRKRVLVKIVGEPVLAPKQSSPMPIIQDLPRRVMAVNADGELPQQRFDRSSAPWYNTHVYIWYNNKL